MQDFQQNLSAKDKVFMMMGSISIIGAAITLVIITTLPLAQASLVSAIVLSCLIVTCASLSKPLYWWMGVGAIAGVIIGIGGVMAGHLAETKDALDLGERLTFVAFLALRFIVAGLEPARTLASRLSASTTILITILALPGIVGYFLTDRRRKPLNPGESDINPSSGRYP